jgi:hypothetical protein
MTREQYDKNLAALKYICSVAIRIFGLGPHAPVQIKFPEAQKHRLLQPNGLPLPKEIDDGLLYKKPSRPKTGLREAARRRRQMGVA